MKEPWRDVQTSQSQQRTGHLFLHQCWLLHCNSPKRLAPAKICRPSPRTSASAFLASPAISLSDVTCWSPIQAALQINPRPGWPGQSSTALHHWQSILPFFSVLATLSSPVLSFLSIDTIDLFCHQRRPTLRFDFLQPDYPDPFFAVPRYQPPLRQRESICPFEALSAQLSFRFNTNPSPQSQTRLQTQWLHQPRY